MAADNTKKEPLQTAADHPVAPETSGHDHVVLYGSRTCPFSQRARIALDSKGLEYKYKETDPYRKPAELLEHNPRGAVPTLVHNGEKVRKCTLKVIEWMLQIVVCMQAAVAPPSAWKTTCRIIMMESFD
jgi:glutaredoxin